MFRKYILFVLLAAAIATAQRSTSPSNFSVLTLDDVLSKVVAHNPALTAAQHSIEAQQHRVPQAGAMPDPNLSVSWMCSAVPFKTMAGDPSSYRGISAMQMMPLGGKLGRQSKIARKDVTTAQDDKVATERKLVADAKAAYYDYYFYGKALEITNRDKKRLEQLADISESRYRVGKAMQQDVLRAHVEVSMLLQRAVTFEQQREIAAARLNTLMGNSPTAALPPAAEIQESRLPELPLLASMAEKTDPVLQREQTQVEKNKLGIELARKQYIPDLSVGYM
jgi:outer membrane protein TolC